MLADLKSAFEIQREKSNRLEKKSDGCKLYGQSVPSNRIAWKLFQNE